MMTIGPDHGLQVGAAFPGGHHRGRGHPGYLGRPRPGRIVHGIATAGVDHEDRRHGVHPLPGLEAPLHAICRSRFGQAFFLCGGGVPAPHQPEKAGPWPWSGSANWPIPPCRLRCRCRCSSLTFMVFQVSLSFPVGAGRGGHHAHIEDRSGPDLRELRPRGRPWWGRPPTRSSFNPGASSSCSGPRAGQNSASSINPSSRAASLRLSSFSWAWRAIRAAFFVPDGRGQRRDQHERAFQVGRDALAVRLKTLHQMGAENRPWRPAGCGGSGGCCG